jgi:hypothetical protein
MLAVSVVSLRRVGAVTGEPTRTINQTRVQIFLGRAADGGGAVSSFLVGLGGKCGLYATGRYRFDVDEPIVRSKTPSILQMRTARGAANAHGSASPGGDRATSVQREEVAFMTLICHDCACSNKPGQGNSVKSASQP